MLSGLLSPASPSYGAVPTTVPDLQDETGGQHRVLKVHAKVKCAKDKHTKVKCRNSQLECATDDHDVGSRL